MTLVQNFPFFSIIIAMFSGILSLALNGRRARNVSLGAISLVTVMSFAVCLYCMDAGQAIPIGWAISRRPGEMKSAQGSWRG